MIVIRLLYNRDTVRINGNGQSDSSMDCCLHLRPESNSKTCKGDSNYRIQLDMLAALKTAGAGAQGRRGGHRVERGAPGKAASRNGETGDE
jgi:hypothetical protein